MSETTSLTLDGAAVLATVRHALGTSASVLEWYVQRSGYVVAVVSSAGERLVVKLAEPGAERPERRFASMAALARLVRAETAVPVFDVLAVDVSCSVLPWEYLITSFLPGQTWMQLHPVLDDSARQVAQRQIGQAAAQLHAVRFTTFGQIGANGSVLDPRSEIVLALAQRARRRLVDPRFVALFLQALDDRAGLFTDPLPATLCHEDLNPHNLLFELDADGKPVLRGVLDFESAWSSTGESDLARLELWSLTRGDALRRGYTEVRGLADGYDARRPLLQLLWCLEFAQAVTSPEHQSVLDGVCDELGIAPIMLA